MLISERKPNPVAAPLLPETFVHIAGIGLRTECRLWRAGVSSWEALADTTFAFRPGVGAALERSRTALEKADLDFFFASLPPTQRWRTFADFGSRFLSVDIETTGMSVYDQVTVIGTEIDGEYRAFVHGSNLDEAADLLASADGLITFNGALFDLPFLARTFPGLKLPPVHVDLRFLARRAGLAGSLKTVETLAELRRAKDIGDISGYEATVLWSEFEYEGRARSLERLVRYNAADTLVLRPLAELVVERMRDELDQLRHAPLDGPTLFDLDAPPTGAKRRPASRTLGRLPAVRARRGRLQVGQRSLALPERRGVEPEVTLAMLQARMREPAARIVGIDLTGSEARVTGWALLEDGLVVTGGLSSTDDIVERTLACRPRLVSIDSPLSLPIGRDCTDDSCPCRAVGGITRHCERQLKRRGVNVYPCLIQSMQALTRRGTAIAQRLRAAGVEVIESYPGAAQDIMRIPRKRASQDQLRAGLARFGLRGLRPAGQLTHDELDAATSAVVGAFYLADLYEALGSQDEDFLIIPDLRGVRQSEGETRDMMNMQPRHLLVGPGAHQLVTDGSTPSQSVDDPVFWDALAEHGAALRAAYVAAPGERLPRRPPFVDVAVHVDDPDRARVLRRWQRDWALAGEARAAAED